MRSTDIAPVLDFLRCATPDAWVEAALGQQELLLIDHANCEKKAASTALNLLFRYPNHAFLAPVLSAIAKEELDHFELMLDLLKQHGIAYRHQTPSLYAGRLLKGARTEEPGRMIDALLCCALIEARSCERMKLLSEHLDDPMLRAFYADLLASEARHFHTYVDLASQVGGRDPVRARLAELAQHEATILTEPGDGLRMHSDA